MPTPYNPQETTSMDLFPSYNTAFQAGFAACAELFGMMNPRRPYCEDVQMPPVTLDVYAEILGFERYLTVTKKYRPSAKSNARSILKKFARYIAEQGTGCSPQTCSALVSHFVEGFVHPSYRYSVIHYLRLFFDHLGWATNPARSIPLPKLNQGRGRHFLSPAECHTLRGVLLAGAKKVSGLRLLHLFDLLLETGMRIGEARKLTWHDVSAEGMVMIRDSKNHTARVVYISAELADRLYQSRQSSLWVFPGKSGRMPVAYGTLCHQFKKVLLQVGVARPGCNWHSLRHTYARACIEEGIPREVIQHLLGHKDIQTTAIYTRMLSEDVRKNAPKARTAVARYMTAGAAAKQGRGVRLPR